MAKDGTMRGNTPGNSRGAGRKRKALVDRIMEGTESASRIITLPDFPEPPDLDAEDIPLFKELFDAPQKIGIELNAREVYNDARRWLIERGCFRLINPQLLAKYAMCVGRWMQCEKHISDIGFLAKHPTTGNPMNSPYVTNAQNFMRQATQIWYMIYQVVRENCSVAYEGNTPQDDVMEKLLAFRQQK